MNVMKLKDLRPAQYNPRKITDEQDKMLGKSMKEFGDLSGIIFNKKTGNIIGGHQRIRHLSHESEIDIKKGIIKTDTGEWTFRQVDWPLKKEKAANLAANKHGGSFSIPELKDILADLDDGSFDMELTGFDEQEIKDMFDFEMPEKEEKEPTSGSENIKECPKCGHTW